MCRRITGLAVLVLAFGVLGGLAFAAAQGLPHPKSTVIVASKSIGGVSIGMPIKRARAAWGGGGKCHTKVTGDIKYEGCDWTGSHHSGFAAISAQNGKVYEVEIVTGTRNGVVTYTSPLVRWRLKGKIHLGSQETEIPKVLPKATQGGAGYQIGTGKHLMVFQSAGGQVEAIALGSSSD